MMKSCPETQETRQVELVSIVVHRENDDIDGRNRRYTKCSKSPVEKDT